MLNAGLVRRAAVHLQRAAADLQLPFDDRATTRGGMLNAIIILPGICGVGLTTFFFTGSKKERGPGEKQGGSSN